MRGARAPRNRSPKRGLSSFRHLSAVMPPTLASHEGQQAIGLLDSRQLSFRRWWGSKAFPAECASTPLNAGLVCKRGWPARSESSGPPKGGLWMKLRFDLQLGDRTLLLLILALAVLLVELYAKFRE